MYKNKKNIIIGIVLILFIIFQSFIIISNKSQNFDNNCLINNGFKLPIEIKERKKNACKDEMDFKLKRKENIYKR